jgi:hypothetical protein
VDIRYELLYVDYQSLLDEVQAGEEFQSFSCR